MATLIPLAEVDPALIEQLLDRAFGEDRHARTAYRMRAGMDWLPALSFAALDDGDWLVGTIQLWPVANSQTRAPAISTATKEEGIRMNRGPHSRRRRPNPRRGKPSCRFRVSGQDVAKQCPPKRAW